MIHGRPYHPQTQGKEERFHRTLKAEVLRGRAFANCAEVQRELDRWRQTYNHERPREALGLAVPGSRYEVSRREFPERLPPIEYDEGDAVRKVNPVGQLSFRGRVIKISEALAGEPVALRRPRPRESAGVLLLAEDHPDRSAREGRGGDVIFRRGKAKPAFATLMQPLPSPRDLLPMCPNTCNPCVRSKHTAGPTKRFALFARWNDGHAEACVAVAAVRHEPLPDCRATVVGRGAPCRPARHRVCPVTGPAGRCHPSRPWRANAGRIPRRSRACL